MPFQSNYAFLKLFLIVSFRVHFGNPRMVSHIFQLDHDKLQLLKQLIKRHGIDFLLHLAQLWLTKFTIGTQLLSASVSNVKLQLFNALPTLRHSRFQFCCKIVEIAI